MNRGLFIAGTIAALFLTRIASAVSIGQIDTFQDGTTDGWFAGGLGMGQVPPVPPQVIANGGPMGTGDQYLQITGLGGPGGREPHRCVKRRAVGRQLPNAGSRWNC